MLGYLLAIALIVPATINGQNFRRPPPRRGPDGPANRGPPPPPPPPGGQASYGPQRRVEEPADRLGGPERYEPAGPLPERAYEPVERGYEPEPPQVADRRFQDYYYDSDVPEAQDNSLQNIQYDETLGTENAVRNKPPPRLDFPVRSGPGISGLQQYEEYEFDRSCQYSSCRCRTAPHPDYADVFFEERNCTSSSGRLIKACPNGLVYTGNGRNGLVSVCDYPHRASWSFGRERHNPPISTEHCDWLYGIFGHETSCTRYWTCWNGTATEQFCIGGLLYNEETHACDWPQNVGGCQKHPLCKDDPNGKVPLGKSCDRYWSCQGGYPRLQRCPAMLVFDKQRKGCVAPPTADCDVPPPPPREEGDDEGFEGDEDQPRGRGRPRARPQNRRRFQQQEDRFTQEDRFQDEGPLPDNRDFVERGGGERGDPRGDSRGNARPLPADFDLPDGALPLNLN